MLWKVPKQYLHNTLSLHVLIVPKRHVRFEADLTDAEVISVHRAKQHVRETLGYQGGLSHVREGDMRLHAGTVPHLHYNLFESNQKGEVRVPVCKDPRDREANTDRTLKFAAQYKSRMTP